MGTLKSDTKHTLTTATTSDQLCKIRLVLNIYAKPAFTPFTHLTPATGAS